MAAVARDSSLDARQSDGSTGRVHLERAARTGSRAAIAALTPLEYPDELEYLRDLATELHGRSGMGQFGPSPLTYTTIKDFALLTNTDLSPEEARALIRIDTAMLSRGESEEEADGTVDTLPSWPTKKPPVVI